jgi:hypothetical protein
MIMIIRFINWNTCEKAVRVSGRPFYGYHARQHTFVKLYFYNPMMVKRAADLLAAGAVMNQVPRNFCKKFAFLFRECF